MMGGWATIIEQGKMGGYCPCKEEKEKEKENGSQNLAINRGIFLLIFVSKRSNLNWEQRNIF